MRRILNAGARVGIFVCLLASFLAAGCQTDGSGKTLSIRLLPGGGCEVAGKPIPADRVESALKAAGAGTQTRIRVALPPDTPEGTIHAFAQRLSAAGYHFIHFEAARKAVSYVEPRRATNPGLR